MHAPPFSALRHERIGTLIGLMIIPALGFLIWATLAFIGRTDEATREMLPAFTTALVLMCAPMTVVMALTVVVRGQQRAKAPLILDELATALGTTRPALTALDQPRLWCTVAGQTVEVVESMVGRGAQVMYPESEDAFRDIYITLASAPQSRVPRGRHARIAVRSDAEGAFTLFVASNGPLAKVGAKLARLEQVASGDARFDDWAVVYTDAPASATRVLADATRRTHLLRMLHRNGTWVNSLLVRPRSTPQEPGAVQNYVLHDQMTAEDVRAGLEDLIAVAQWTHDHG